MIQRPRNRQSRKQHRDSDRAEERNGAGGNRNRGRGAPGGGSLKKLPSNVPNIRQVVCGAHVSIVLKVDQFTGRQVQGTVAEVLTSGDHPRGIKVRLVDGRVGRVQRMVSEAEAKAGSEGLRNLGRNGEPSTGSLSASFSTLNIRDRDVREDEEIPTASFSLAAFFPSEPSLSHENEQNSHRQQSAAIKTSNSVCPVCYDFEGDELAVAHHVNSHFD